MRVLRENKESLMAVLEAFVYDPLVSWRLLVPNPGKDEKVEANSTMTNKALSLEEDIPDAITKEKSIKSVPDELDYHIPEATNEKALQVTNRIQNKLTGKDFPPRVLDVTEQVNMLIKQATDIENLCQSYIGWSPYW